MRYTTQVIKGKGRGKGIGFPTFNLQIPSNLLLKSGIYACWVWIEDVKYRGAMHYGPIPTFNETTLSLEIFVLDFQPNDANDPTTLISFTPVKYLRPIKTFSLSQALTRQISLDVSRVKKILSTRP